MAQCSSPEGCDRKAKALGLCQKHYMREYYRSTPERREKNRLRVNAYNQQPEIKERHAQRMNELYRTDPDFRERAKARSRRRKQAMGDGYRRHLPAQYAVQKGLCYYCRKPFPIEKMEIDHVIALRGDVEAYETLTDPSNLVAACRPCNIGKGTRRTRLL